MGTIVFVQDERFTPEGEKVKAWMEAQFAEADATNDLHTLNGMTGYLANYYLMAFKGNGRGFGMTPEQWFGENRYGGAMAAYRDMKHFEEKAESEAKQAAEVAENTQATSDLAAKIEALAAELTEVKAQLEAERAKNETPTDDPEPEPEPEPKKRGRKAKAEPVEESEDEPEAETGAHDAYAREEDQDGAGVAADEPDAEGAPEGDGGDEESKS